MKDKNQLGPPVVPPQHGTGAPEDRGDDMAAPATNPTSEFVEIGNFAMLVERGLDPNVAKRVVKQYMDKCAEVVQLQELLGKCSAVLNEMSEPLPPLGDSRHSHG